MIPCFICANDASTGWVKGFAPAPDSQKMALCKEHNTPDNRRAVAVSWQEMLRKDITLATRLARPKNKSGQHIVSVHFTGGGMLSFTCLDCRATEHGSLRIEAADGSQTFIPLQHVKEYVLRPVPEFAQEPADALFGEPEIQQTCGAEPEQLEPALPAGADAPNIPALGMPEAEHNAGKGFSLPALPFLPK